MATGDVDKPISDKASLGINPGGSVGGDGLAASTPGAADASAADAFAADAFAADGFAADASESTVDSAANSARPPIGQRKGWQEIYTPANLVTIIRILLVPAFIILMLAPWASWLPEPTLAAIVKPWAAALMFILLAATDGLDGYLARSRNETTTFGMLLDPLADKILVAAALLALIELGKLPAWIALVILGREFLVSGLRMVAAAEGKVIAASIFGKVKTIFQIIAVVTFIVKDSLITMLLWIGGRLGLMMAWGMNILAWVIMALTLIITIGSLIDYFINSAEVLGFERSGRWLRKPIAEPPVVAKSAVAEVDSIAADPIAADSIAATLTTPTVVLPSITATATLLIPVSQLAAAVLDQARNCGLTLATAESCTGGLIAAALTDVPGSSAVFNGAVVSYANSVKQGLLEVSSDTLAGDGAVSEACVIQMAEAARRQLGADLAVAVSGIAGPDGGSADKPVGTVWLAVASAAGTTTYLEHFAGDRSAVREQTVRQALLMLQQTISSLQI